MIAQEKRPHRISKEHGARIPAPCCLPSSEWFIHSAQIINSCFKAPAMIRTPTIFLQAVIVLVAAGALAFLLWEPQVEGRNTHATQFEIYFKDPFLAFAYVASIPFFVALYQAFKLLGYVGRNEVFSERSVKAMRTIKRCGLAILGFIAVGEVWIMLQESDDRAGGVAMGIVMAFATLIVTAAAAVFERLLQNAVDLKSEHDLTV
jgi:hypothetical protein